MFNTPNDLPASLSELCAALAQAKEHESAAKARRLEIEDLIARFFDFPADHEGGKTIKAGAFKVRATAKLTKSIDAEALQQIAQNHGIPSNVLGTLFRWKPEINAKEWKAADPVLRTILSGAITSKPAKLAITLEKA